MTDTVSGSSHPIHPAPGPLPRGSKVREPGEVLTLVPYHLGFAPGRCVVALIVRQGVLGGYARVPTPENGWREVPDECWVAASRGLRSAWGDDEVRGPWDGAILMSFDLSLEHSRQGMARLAIACALAGLPVIDRLTVSRGRWCEFGCEQLDEWRPVPRPVDVPAVSEYVGIGVAPVAGREHLRARFAVDPARSAPVAEALATLKQEYRLDTVRGIEAVTRWVSAADCVFVEHDPHEIAQGLALLEHGLWRDALYSRVAPAMTGLLVCTPLEKAAQAQMPECPGDVTSQLADIAAYAPPGHRGSLLAVIALAHWAMGRGALACAAAEEALADQPGQSMAETVLTGLSHGLEADPARWPLSISA